MVILVASVVRILLRVLLPICIASTVVPQLLFPRWQTLPPAVSFASALFGSLFPIDQDSVVSVTITTPVSVAIAWNFLYDVDQNNKNVHVRGVQ